ncbi:MAG: ComF family protein, partial [bacterium]|nr:ComF family protein [bacterium]
MEILMRVLLPARCGGCGLRGAGLCGACAAELAGEHFLLNGVPPLEVTALGRYRGALRRAVLAMKRGRRDVVQALGRAMARYAPAHGEMVVAAPTSRARRAARGFDQAALLARAIGGAPQALLALEGSTQRGAGRAARLARRVRFVRGNVRG